MLQHILGEAEVARRQVLREVLRLLHLAAGSSRHLWVLAKPWFVSELLLASRFEFSFAFCSFAEGSCPFCVCFFGGGESFYLCTCQAGCQQDVLWESATALAYSLTKVGQRDPALAGFSHTHCISLGGDHVWVPFCSFLSLNHFPVCILLHIFSA